LFDRAAGFLLPRPQISDADARSGGQGWPVFGPPLRRRAASLTAVSTTADWIITGRKSARLVACELLWFSLAWFDVAARSTVLYAVQGCWPHHGPQGFDAAMSRTHSTRDRRRKNRAVVEARPSRDSNPPRDAAKGYFDRLSSDGWRCSFSVPLERRACSPHAMQDDGKLAGNRHGCLLSSDAFAKGFAPGLQRAWSR
jgi:hypothetical protein